MPSFLLYRLNTLTLSAHQAESVTHHLAVPVLQHKSFKPAYSCISAIRTYFTSLRSPILDHELIVVGDRIFTDIVMANRMRIPNSTQRTFSTSGERDALESGSSDRPLAIWTTGVWHRESMLMRWMERQLVQSVHKWSTPLLGEPKDTSIFVRELPKVEPLKKPSPFSIDGLLSRMRRN